MREVFFLEGKGLIGKRPQEPSLAELKTLREPGDFLRDVFQQEGLNLGLGGETAVEALQALEAEGYETRADLKSAPIEMWNMLESRVGFSVPNIKLLKKAVGFVEEEKKEAGEKKPLAT